MSNSNLPEAIVRVGGLPAAGAVIGAVIGGPIGAAIGGIVGGIVTLIKELK